MAARNRSSGNPFIVRKLNRETDPEEEVNSIPHPQLSWLFDSQWVNFGQH